MNISKRIYWSLWEKVLNQILIERQKAKYYTILIDATPDITHSNRYLETNVTTKLQRNSGVFVKCNLKTGENIANEILNELHFFKWL